MEADSKDCKPIGRQPRFGRWTLFSTVLLGSGVVGIIDHSKDGFWKGLSVRLSTWKAAM